MELALVNSEGALVDLEMGMGISTEAVGKFLDSQRELFHSQIEQLQKIVVAQCTLTGANPLSQEMAAGALSIKIGKRPRDLLNPKSIKYMQSVFSIKDTIGKKETREISALCGATITQVREFFAGQRSRVRKLVRLSREKAIRLDACRSNSNEFVSNPNTAITISEPIPLNSVNNRMVVECTEIHVNSGNVNTVPEEKQISMNLVNLKTVEESTQCSLQEETIPGINLDDKKFLDNIFNLMRKEESFADQVKLMEWILQINNSAILYWFVTKGGITILATWLGEAAAEEQTTMILTIFKVLCHLPLHKALPIQMSAILQCVNKLRFYRISDISNKARFLLSRWSKLFVRSQNVKRSTIMNFSTEAQKERIRKQRISEILKDGSWQSRIGIPADILALDFDASEKDRQLESKPVLKLLPASYDSENGKSKRVVSSSKTKERRKVLLVEQPDRVAAGRSIPFAKAMPSNLSRPLSADDIQKAKMRAIFMQDKYGKMDAAANEKSSANLNDHKVIPASQKNKMLHTSKSSNLGVDEDKNHVVSTEASQEIPETSDDPKPCANSKELLLEKLKSNKILWQRPPEVKIIGEWRVGIGENSKEVEVQTQRNRRAVETFYLNAHDIPSNSKDPWDVEMDFDDSLTPEIPIEQPPDVDAGDGPEYEDGAELPLSHPPENIDQTQAPSAIEIPQDSNGILEPDLELLAVLLKNPDLVFALTSGAGGGFNDAQTVALLDMLKRNGAGTTGTSNGLVGSLVEKQEPTSLPSPTPHTEPVRAGWRREPEMLAQSPLLHPQLSRSGFAPSADSVGTPQTPTSLLGNAQSPIISPSLVQPQIPNSVLSTQQHMVNINSAAQQPSDVNLLNRPLPLNHRISSGTSPSQCVIDPIVPTKQFKFSSPMATISSSHRQENFEAVQRYTSSLSNLSFPQKSPSLEHPANFPSPLQGVPSAAAALDSWNSRQNGFLEASTSRYRVPVNQNRYEDFTTVARGTPPLYSQPTSGHEEVEEYRDYNARRTSAEYRLAQNDPELGRMFNGTDPSRNSSLRQENFQKSGRRWWGQDDDRSH